MQTIYSAQHNQGMIREEPVSEPLKTEADLALYERTPAVVLASSTFHIQFKTLHIKLGYEPRHCRWVRLFPGKGANTAQKKQDDFVTLLHCRVL